ncbi:MAG: hypothetical protein JWP60_3806 [Ramlibacter sp.]|jgi:hypothetical protein|nr:hypothetical protein [Ramlibacter sp.]
MEIAPAGPVWLLLASAFAVGGLAVAMLARLLDTVLDLG